MQNSLKQKIESGQFVITAELGPPRSSDGDVIRKKAAYFRTGIDGVNVTDNQTAIVRLSSIAAAKILLDEGLEPIIQMTCRDRNRIAIQSDLLGAHALGIRNVLCLTGDHPRFGDHPESRGVFDLDSVQLIAMVRALNEGSFLSGESMKKSPQFFIGGAANPFAEPLSFRVTRLEKKIRAGAHFIQTQPVFQLERFQTWLEGVRRIDSTPKPVILAGIMPVRSARALKIMQDEVPGITIDASYIQRMESAKDPEQEGVRIAVEIIAAIRRMEGIQGLHLMPLLWEKITPRILKEAGLADIR
jgi:methylenetetrahydrofolate reductase (NADPH)